jgi:hypothetical protein
VHVADDVERPVFVLQVVPERLALDGRRLDLLGGRELVDVAEPFALEVTYGAAELLALLANDVRPEISVRALTVPTGST